MLSTFFVILISILYFQIKDNTFDDETDIFKKINFSQDLQIMYHKQLESKDALFLGTVNMGMSNPNDMQQCWITTKSGSVFSLSRTYVEDKEQQIVDQENGIFHFFLFFFSLSLSLIFIDNLF